MINSAKIADISWMVGLSHEKRAAYEKIQPNFWKMAENSNEIQAKWFEEELKNPKVIALTCENNLGFIIGKLVNPPEVYSAGLTLMIDDFCVKSPELWGNIGKKLLEKCIEMGKFAGAEQILVVCGKHDRAKYNLLESMELSTASVWCTRKI